MLSISGRVSSKLGTISRTVTVLDYELTARHLLLPKVRSTLYVLFTSRSVTEYALPLAVAVVPVAELLWSRIRT